MKGTFMKSVSNKCNKRGAYNQAICARKDNICRALADVAPYDRFLISDDLVKKVCKQAHTSVRSYNNYYRRITDPEGTVYSEENRHIAHAVADMVFREEKYYLDLAREYNREPIHDEDIRCTYIEKITEHIGKNHYKYLYELKNNRMNLFLLFFNAILTVYDRIPKTGLPMTMEAVGANSYFLRLERTYLRWAEKEFRAEHQAPVQAEIYRIMGG